MFSKISVFLIIRHVYLLIFSDFLKISKKIIIGNNVYR